MKLHGALVLSLLSLLAPPALAQPADLPIPPATAQGNPSGVKVRQTPDGTVYVDARGHVLYGMDMRTLMRWGADPAQHCSDACAAEWQPLLAPADAKVNFAFPQGFGDRGRKLPEGFVNPQIAPDWSVIQGPQGPQWVYKGWHLVFTHRGDRPGDTSHDGHENMVWNTLKYVPPRPQPVAPGGVSTVLAGGNWALADAEGHVLFTGKCKADACHAWEPLRAGMADRGLGQWRVSTSGDRPQWRLRGKPVFVSRESDPLAAPAGTEILRP